MAHTWWHSTAAPNNDSFKGSIGTSPIVANTVSDFFTKTIPGLVFGKATAGIKNAPKPVDLGSAGTLLTPTQRTARKEFKTNIKAVKQNVAATKSAAKRTKKPGAVKKVRVL